MIIKTYLDTEKKGLNRDFFADIAAEHKVAIIVGDPLTSAHVYESPIGEGSKLALATSSLDAVVSWLAAKQSCVLFMYPSVPGKYNCIFAEINAVNELFATAQSDSSAKPQQRPLKAPLPPADVVSSDNDGQEIDLNI